MGATTLGSHVTVTTGTTITTLPIASPITIVGSGNHADSYWNLSGSTLVPENLGYKVGLGVVADGTTSDHILLHNSANNEIRKIDGSLFELKADTRNWSTITSTPTTLSGYGITDQLQPLDADLTSIAGLGYSSLSFLKKTGANTWSLDTTQYETAITNPGEAGLVLTSDIYGHRSWIAQVGGGGSGMAAHGHEYHNTLNTEYITNSELNNTTLSGTLSWGGVGLTTTFTKLNYLTSATGTTGTTSTNIVFSTSPVLTTPNIGAATGTSLTVTGDVIAYSA